MFLPYVGFAMVNPMGIQGGGSWFKLNEHALVYAQLERCLGIASWLLDTECPFKVKSFMSLIPRLKEWKDAEPQYLYEINMEKFQQHPDLAHFLVPTGTMTL